MRGRRLACRLFPSLTIAAAAAILFTGASPGATAAQTILNVERLQRREASGWHFGVEGGLDLARGNTDHTDLQGGFATGYRWSGDWARLFAGINYEGKGDGSVDNDQYLHLRYNHWWRSRLQSFHFVQYQASHTGVLRRRYLAGSGLRLRVLERERTTFDLGSGAMFEYEHLDRAQVSDDHPITSRVVRMANLLVLNRRLSGDVRFVGVGYVQPRFDDVGDARLLSDLSILIALTDQVDLAVRLQWRHDTVPPGGVDADDLSFTSGFTVSLR